MTRIAVCWSGQSRIHRLNDVDNNQYYHWNKIWDLHQWVLQDFDVTHYDHTWDDHKRYNLDGTYLKKSK